MLEKTSRFNTHRIKGKWFAVDQVLQTSLFPFPEGSVCFNGCRHLKTDGVREHLVIWDLTHLDVRDATPLAEEASHLRFLVEKN